GGGMPAGAGGSTRPDTFQIVRSGLSLKETDTSTRCKFITSVSVTTMWARHLRCANSTSSSCVPTAGQVGPTLNAVISFVPIQLASVLSSKELACTTYSFKPLFTAIMPSATITSATIASSRVKPRVRASSTRRIAFLRDGELAVEVARQREMPADAFPRDVEHERRDLAAR